FVCGRECGTLYIKKIRQSGLVFEVGTTPAGTGYSHFRVVITDETKTVFTTDAISVPLTLFKRPSGPTDRLKMDEVTPLDQDLTWEVSRKAHSAVCDFVVARNSADG